MTCVNLFMGVDTLFADPELRHSLSEELHARAFHDFDGAGRFIRFVYLVGNDDSKVVKYVNKYLRFQKVIGNAEYGKVLPS